ncbi:hypothetical protein F8M41_006136 [Gigaspora margarita]|uniref:Uncharacterized protein n=1 Tax=Gigaspora margarita TaxID=4874 RepID=A0A8H4EVD7_GIGMA|nr:hypothetical protein F8M41_006136 [Gigaspora margarita]
MLDSILQRKTDPVCTYKIILSDKILSERKDILEHIRRHSKIWTKHNPSDTSYKAEWKEDYLLLKCVDPSIYNNATEEITIEELTDTISKSPKDKATGPFAIPNEVLQHLPPSPSPIY